MFFVTATKLPPAGRCQSLRKNARGEDGLRLRCRCHAVRGSTVCVHHAGRLPSVRLAAVQRLLSEALTAARDLPPEERARVLLAYIEVIWPKGSTDEVLAALNASAPWLAARNGRRVAG